MCEWQKAVGILLFLAFPSVSATTFEVWRCRDFDAGNLSVPAVYRRLEGDVSLDCNSQTHGSYRNYAVLMLTIWPIGVPLYMTCMFLRNRKGLQVLTAGQAALEAQVSARHELRTL